MGSKEVDTVTLEKVIIKANTGADAIKRAPIVNYDTDLRCLRIGDISNNKPFKEWGFTEATEDVRSKFLLKKNNILIARTGNTIGVIKFIDKDLNSLYNNGLICLQVDENSYNPKYVFYALSSNDFKSFIYQISGGTSTQPNIKICHMLKFKIINFPLSEQKAIADILSALDNNIQLNNQMNKTLEEMAQAIFKSWFIDFAPFQDGEFIDSELGKIPKGWKVGILSDLFILQRGFDLPYKKRNPGVYKVISASGPNGNHDQYMVKGPGVVTGRSGVLGNVFYIQEDYWPLNTTLWIKEYKNSNPLHAYHFLKTIALQQYNAGSAVPTLNRNHVHNFSVVVPEKKVLDGFDKLIKPLFQRIRSNELENETLAQLRDTLLPKLMSGEIRVTPEP
ncbi:restriction endonuclease subunit S [Desulfotomaculum defluvii]